MRILLPLVLLALTGCAAEKEWLRQQQVTAVEVQPGRYAVVMKVSADHPLGPGGDKVREEWLERTMRERGCPAYTVIERREIESRTTILGDRLGEVSYQIRCT